MYTRTKAKVYDVYFIQEQKLGYMTIIVYKSKSKDIWRLLYTRAKARAYDDYCMQEQKLGYMTIIVYKNKN